VAASEVAAWHSLLGDWPVSGPACEIAAAALRDKAWIAATRTRLADDRKRLDHILGHAGLKPIGGTDLFGLFEAPQGVDLLDHFASAGILIRGFATAPQRYRFGLPADEAAWRRLEAACSTLR
jgi:cobalamin biosynthesis protein CobC